MSNRLKTLSFVFIFSLFISLLNSLSFFIGLINQPSNTFYLGSIHFWEDYYFYLNHFFQGAHGAWLVANRYTSEPTPTSIIYWSNLLFGKIGNLFGLDIVISYIISLIILTITTLMTMYIIYTKLFEKNIFLAFPALLFATLATSLQNRTLSNEGKIIWWPFQIWRTPHFAFDRLGGAPHQMFITALIFLVLLSFFWNLKYTKIKYFHVFLPIILCITLTTLSPSAPMALLLSLWIGFILIKLIFWKLPNYLLMKLIGITVGIVPTLFYINILYNRQPFIQSKLWEAANHSFTDWPFLALSIGPILLFAVPGVIVTFINIIKQIKSNFLKSNTNLIANEIIIKKYFILTGFIFLLFCYIVFMFAEIPQKLGISNLRFLFPAQYIFWGAFAALGVDILVKLVIKLIKIQHSITVYFLIFVFIFMSVPTLIWEINFRLPKKTDASFIYLPNNIFTGFNFLEQRKPYEDIVLANPINHYDSLIPTLSGHTSYSGHMLQTINNSQKQNQSWQFFSGNMINAADFLKNSHIKLVFFTKNDGNQIKFEQSYPFLSKVYGNTDVSIYEVK